ncbi:MAG: hypothetical protein AAGG02_13165 [Cyanobacteria bacterium P01_H01_bin.15]
MNSADNWFDSLLWLGQFWTDLLRIPICLVVYALKIRLNNAFEKASRNGTNAEVGLPFAILDRYL